MNNKTHTKAYQLKIGLKYSKPLIWRRVLVPSYFTLHELHLVIQSVFNWANCHLYSFTLGQWQFASNLDVWDPEDDDYENSKNIYITKYLEQPGDKLDYMYDFGDGWQHTIVLEKILSDKIVKPQLIKAVNYAPVEDCGALTGWYDSIEFLSTYPKKPTKDDKERLEWLMELIPELEELNDIREFDTSKVDDEEIKQKLEHYREIDKL